MGRGVALLFDHCWLRWRQLTENPTLREPADIAQQNGVYQNQPRLNECIGLQASVEALWKTRPQMPEPRSNTCKHAPVSGFGLARSAQSNRKIRSGCNEAKHHRGCCEPAPSHKRLTPRAELPEPRSRAGIDVPDTRRSGTTSRGRRKPAVRSRENAGRHILVRDGALRSR